MSVLSLASYGHFFIKSHTSSVALLFLFNTKQDCGGESHGYPTISFY